MITQKGTKKTDRLIIDSLSAFFGICYLYFFLPKIRYPTEYIFSLVEEKSASLVVLNRAFLTKNSEKICQKGL